MFARTHRGRCLGLLALLGVGGVQAVEAQVVVPLPPIPGTGLVHVRSISPRTGPAGTEVHIRADDLPPNVSVQLAFGELHSGYEVVGIAQTDSDGELTATARVPETRRGHWDHFEMLVLLNEASARIATADPFHVTNDEGLVQRSGVIEISWPGCPALKSWDGVTYALVGGHAVQTLMAAVGQELVVEGRIVEGTCGLQNAIELVRLARPS